MPNKKKKYVKRSLLDRMIYYNEKAIKSKKEYDTNFAIGYMFAIGCEKEANKDLVNSKGFTAGYIRGSKAMDTIRNVEF